MASLNMNGPYDSSNEEVDRVITKTSAGNYALGYTNDEGTFIVKYVGRSDDDVNDRIKDWVDEYKKFKYSYASSSKAAFEKECKNYHDFGGSESLDNKIHPDRSDNTDWKCPICDIYD